MEVVSKIIRYKENYKGFISSLSHNKGDAEEIKLIEFKHCCENALSAWEDGFINFGEFDNMLNKINNICIYKIDVFPEGAFGEEMEIKYCPFCGEEIEIKTIEEE